MTEDMDASRLASLFNSSPDAIVLVGADGEIIRANDRVETVFGYEPADLEGRRIETLVPEPEREQHPAQRESYMENPTTRPMGANLSLRARRKDGSTFPVDISLSPIETGDGHEVMAAVRDITEREKLRRKYQTLMESAPDAMVITDAETGEILEVNRQATELVEASEETLVGRNETVLYPDDTQHRELSRHDADSARPATSGVTGEEIRYVETASGGRIPVEVSAQETALNGQRVGISVFRDVSARHEYEKELHRQIERLETLAEVLSHDLRNPLNVAEANVEMMMASGDCDRLETVDTAHDRMEALIDDALTLIQEGYEVESTEPVELDTIASDCWQHVQTKDATIRVARDGIVYADTNRVKNLFENLFRNAIEHGGEDVTVRVGVTDGGFFVADDGSGIPEENREDVLEPGWTTDGKGTGLGLNIVSEIAAAHGWNVAVSESEGGGARFDFTGVRNAVYDDAFETRT
jgi:PAS domain S-box-containing protein